MNNYPSLYRIQLFLLFLGLILAGCTAQVSPTPSNDSPANTAAGAFKVALILPGAIDDQAWSQSGYEGLELISQELGAQVAHTPNVSDADAEQVFRQYAKDGFDFIIGHGGQYVAAAEIVAEEFPRAKFAVVVGGYAGNNKNLGALGFRREVDYLCGVVAGLKTETNKVAYIGGEAQPHMVTSAKIFENGVKAANPAAEVSIDWVESWSDQDRTRELAEKEVAAGTDVILANINQASRVVFEVAKNAKISAIGWTKDQHELAPDTIVTSAIIRMPNLLLEGAILVQQGRWEGKQYNLGLRDGVLDLAPFHGLLTAEEEEKVNAVKADLLNGEVDILP